jgi:hypothetical protein
MRSHGVLGNIHYFFLSRYSLNPFVTCQSLRGEEFGSRGAGYHHEFHLQEIRYRPRESGGSGVSLLGNLIP